MFEQQRPATPAETAALYAIFDVINPPAVLAEAQVSVVATRAELAAIHTVLQKLAPAGGDSFYTVAECGAAGPPAAGQPTTRSPTAERSSRGRIHRRRRCWRNAPPRA